MPILRYKFGQERRIVKENTGFDDSIFRDQYVQALSPHCATHIF